MTERKTPGPLSDLLRRDTKLPSHVRGAMEFVLVSSIEEVLSAALAPSSGAEARA